MTTFPAVPDQNDPFSPFVPGFWTQQIAPFGMTTDTRALHVVTRKLWDAAMCKKIIALGQAGLSEKHDTTELKLRQTQIFPDQAQINGIDLFQRYAQEIDDINNAEWDFCLSGWYEPLVYLEYDVDGFMRPHMDTTENDRTKVGFTTVLNRPGKDFQGGEFDIQGVGPVTLNRGDTIFFPGFVTHQVHPVTEGIRQGLTGWVAGPFWH